MERLCTKCGAQVKTERSAIRLTLRCTNAACGHLVVKNIAPLGYG